MPPLPIRPGAGPRRLAGSRQVSNTTPIITRLDPNSGRLAGGTLVTIYGFNFRASSDGTGPLVYFGDNLATSVTVIDQHSLTCLTPAGDAVDTVSVSVQCQDQVGTLDDAYTYIVAQITEVTPAFGTIAGGLSVLLSGFNFVAGSTVTFGGVSATGVTVLDDQHISLTTPAHALGFVDIEITSPAAEVVTLRNGFQYTLLTRGEDIRRMPGIQIRDVLNNTPNTCDFTVDGDSNQPIAGEKIQIIDEEDGDRLLFAGTIQYIEQIYEGQTDQLAWRCQAVDFTWLLNRRRPIAAYTQVSASSIVKDLVAKFAPGFTTAFVQSNLAKITITFDGSEDFSTCLSNIAEAIGGGHWYVDYNQDVHFFHTIPPSLQDVNKTTPVLQLGPGTAPVCVVGARIPIAYWYASAFYIFQMTFTYDNGVESSYSPASNPVGMSGEHQFNFTSLPLGATVGGHTVVKRTLYYTYLGPCGGSFNLRNRKRFCDINDNTTTAFTTYFAELGASVMAVSAPASTSVVRNIKVIAPAYAAESDSAPNALFLWDGILVGGDSPYLSQEPQPEINNPRSLPRPYTAGDYAFKASNVYRDLTESLPGPISNVVTTINSTYGSRNQPSVASYKVRVSGVPAGKAINGVEVIARRIYAFKGDALDDPSQAVSWWLIPNNTETSADIDPATASVNTTFSHFLPPPNQPPPDRPLGARSGDVPVWPNNDGPSLENFDPPEDLTDASVYLLRDPQFTSKTDLSQIRNRVRVRGLGTSLIAAANIGDTTLSVAELRFFQLGGGQVYINGSTIAYVGLDELEGAGTVYLQGPLEVAFDNGTVIQNYLQVDDTEAQQALGKIELDKNGNPTDGIHEIIIADDSLENSLQVYMRAHAELELFARPIITISYATRDPKTRSGATVHVDLTDPPCVGDFLIQDVTIDQVHDESDDLTPRYLVKASSVKFELTDLLLKILSGKNTGGSSASGLGPVVDFTGNSIDLSNRVMWAQHHPIAAGAASLFGVGMNAPSNVGTAPSYPGSGADILDPIGAPTATASSRKWLTYATSGALDDYSGHTGQDWFFVENNLDLTYYVRTGPNISNVLYLVGLSDQGISSIIPVNLNLNMGKMALFRYAPTIGDGGWVGALQNVGTNSTPTLTPTLAPVAPNTEYKLRIITSGGPDTLSTRIGFSVNDSEFSTLGYADTPVTIGTPSFNFPTPTVAAPQGMQVMCGVVGKSAAVKKLSFRMLSLIMG